MQLIDTPPITADYSKAISPAWSVPRMRQPAARRSRRRRRPLRAPRRSSSGWRRSRPSWSAQPPVTEESDPTIEYVRTLLVANKIDLPGAADRLDIVREMYGQRFPIHVLVGRAGDRPGGAAHGPLRVPATSFAFTPRSPASRLTWSRRSPARTAARCWNWRRWYIEDFAEKLKSARIWGTGVYRGTNRDAGPCVARPGYCRAARLSRREPWIHKSLTLARSTPPRSSHSVGLPFQRCHPPRHSRAVPHTIRLARVPPCTPARA